MIFIYESGYRFSVSDTRRHTTGLQNLGHIVALSGLVLATGPKVRGFKPGRGR
jgi:hypothetical protein